MKLKKTLLILIILTILLSGCNPKMDEEVKAPTETEKLHKKIIDDCIDQGGIPILSHWDNRLVDCIFKEAK